MGSHNDIETLRKQLKNLGFVPGPITESTKKVYVWKLKQLQSTPQIDTITKLPNTIKVYSEEIKRILTIENWSSLLSTYSQLERQIISDFSNDTIKWREGLYKTSFTYILLDSRITQNLPDRVDSQSHINHWETFLSAIFYIGKGKRCRPYDHLKDAIELHRNGIRVSPNSKLQRILNIWNTDEGIICLHVFQNVTPVEAYTREAAMISALRLDNVENLRLGEFYGVAQTWTESLQQKLGVYLLYKAYKIFLLEGERKLNSNDII